MSDDVHKDNPCIKELLKNIPVKPSGNGAASAKNEKTKLIQQLADSCKIDLTEILPPPPVAMQLIQNGEPTVLFTKGNFSIITGPAKSRKTYLVSMLMATAVSGDFQEYLRCINTGMNILFDTEQSKYKVQQIAKRIAHLSQTNNPDNLQIYSFRTLDPDQRIDLIEHVLATTPNLNFVAIDGIIDLEIDPILQSDQAQRIISKLMKWSEIYNIHICCVLHYNKTITTLLGHLGSFAHRKADAIISVTKNIDDSMISEVKPVDCREKEFIPFAFSVDPNGFPYLMEDFVVTEKAVKKENKNNEQKVVKSITPINIEPDQHTEILKEVFKLENEIGYGDFWRSIKSVVNLITGKKIGDNTAKDFVVHYSRAEMIAKKGAGRYATYVQIV